jgi:glycogen(starch) synthase
VKILLLSRPFAPAVGGMERFAEELATWLACRGHDVTVATRIAGHAEDHRRPYRVLRALRLPVLQRALREADAVHVNGLSLRGIAAAVSARRRPVVTHAGYQAVCPTGLAWSPAGGCHPGPGPCRVCPGTGLRGQAAVRAHRAGARAAASNACVSRYAARRLALPRSVTVYNPVHIGAFDGGAPAEDDLVAVAARMVREKGLDLLIRTLRFLPKVRLEVAGDGPLRTRLVRLAAEEGVDRRVRFRGSLPVEGVAELYTRAAVVCVPSLWPEPFGYAAAEAMAMGRAVVATPRGALVELLDEGRGFIAKDASPKALAEALSRALGEPGPRLEAARRAKAFAVSELSVEAIGPRYESLYEGAAA